MVQFVLRLKITSNTLVFFNRTEFSGSLTWDDVVDERGRKAIAEATVLR